MPWLNRILVQPSPAGLTEALRAAHDGINGRATTRQLPWPLPDADAFRAAVQEKAEGQWQWEGPGQNAGTPERSVLAVAWWRDVLGRTHLRLYGRRDRHNRAARANLFGRDRRPALSLIYPGRSLVRFRGGQEEVVVLCACGACGTAQEVGWTGPCCGPCHDRAARGEAVPAPPSAGWELTGHETPYVDVSVSPCGTALASAGAGGTLIRWDVATGRPTATADLGEYSLPELTLGPGGRLVAVHHALQAVAVWGLDAGARLATVPSTNGDGVFSPDGSEMFTMLDGRPAAFEAATARPTAPFAGRRSRWPHALTVSADGRVLAHKESGSHEVVLWDVPGRSVRSRHPLGEQALSPPAFHPDGRAFVVLHSLPVHAGLSRLLDLTSGQEVPLPWPPDEHLRELVFAPDGRLLVGNGLGTFRVWAQSGHGYETLLEGRSQWEGVARFAFLPGGCLLTFDPAAKAVRIWPAELLRPEGGRVTSTPAPTP
jgi:WD40 repeat protein